MTDLNKLNEKWGTTLPKFENQIKVLRNALGEVIDETGTEEEEEELKKTELKWITDLL